MSAAMDPAPAGTGPRRGDAPGLAVLAAVGGLLWFLLAVAGLPASAYAGYIAVTGPFAARLGHAMARAREAGLDPALAWSIQVVAGVPVAVTAFACWQSALDVVVAPFRVETSSRIRSLVGVLTHVPMGALFLAMGWGAWAVARHLVSAGGGDPDTVAAWARCVRDLRGIDTDPSVAFPVALAVLAYLLAQYGVLWFATIPGALARLASRRPRGTRPGLRPTA